MPNYYDERAGWHGDRTVIPLVSLMRYHGWTFQLITQYLGKPDRYAPQPKGRQYISLYLHSRVAEVTRDNPDLQRQLVKNLAEADRTRRRR